MFCIVEFMNTGGEVAIAHRSWMKGNQCYWPPFWKNSTKLLRALHNGDLPNPTSWTLHEVHVVGNRYFETYALARAKLNVPQSALDNSELSGAEQLGIQSKRRKIAPKQDDTSSDESLDMEPVVTPKRKIKKRAPTRGMETIEKPPTPPRFEDSSQNMAPISGPTLVAVDSLYANNLRPVSPDPPSSRAVTSSFSSPNSMFLNESRISALRNEPNVQPLLPVALGEKSQTSKVSSEFVYAAIHELKCQQELLMAKVDLVLDYLRTMKETKSVGEPAKSRGISLPLSSPESIKQLDAQLKQSTDFREEMISLLATKGGNHPAQMTYRIVAALMTDEMLLRYSFSGQKEGKLSFKDTMFTTCICEAVRRQPKGSLASDKDVEKSIEYWLRKTSTRLSKKKPAPVTDNSPSDNENLLEDHI